MQNKIMMGITLIALPLTLAACGNSSSNGNKKSSASTSSSMTTKKVAIDKSGEIVGPFTSKDKSVVGATKPGQKVSFKVNMAKGDTTYLHFAFMHAASGAKGWYFAPMSANGIMLKKADFNSGKMMNITNKIGLFAAPNKSTVKKVMKNDGKLMFEKTNKFMKADVKMSGDMYQVTIQNKSKSGYATPFSSGVWGISSMGKKSFDQMPSAALSKLATSGDHTALLKSVPKN